MKYFIIMLPILLPITKGYSQDDEKFVLAIHGGAGTISKEKMTPERAEEYLSTLRQALRIGHSILQEGGSSIDAVEKVVMHLENSPLFNAGKGAVFTHDEKNEMDASMMDGQSLNAGAVAGITTVKNPISAARKVMENSKHVLLSGHGAEQFAKDSNLEIAGPDYFRTEKRFKQLQKAKEKELLEEEGDDTRGQVMPLPGLHDEDSEIAELEKFGTVGAVALDKMGNLAAATSTGGMTNKKHGRIGDSPIIGAGTYANNKSCAISCTGHGEFFMRYLVAYDVAALMEYKNLSLDAAAELVVNEKLKNAGGQGGLIGVDKEGNISMPFNTSGMYRGFIKPDGVAHAFIFSE